MDIAKQEIVKYCHKLYENHFVVATDGNVSILAKSEAMLITPTGTNKGDITEDMIIMMDGEGRVVEGIQKPSSEAAMHMECYKMRADIKAVVHAHPPFATALSATEHADTIPDDILLPEILLTVGRLGIIEYDTPGSIELSLKAAEVMTSHNGALMRNHGVLTVGKDIKEAYFRLESIELYCKVRLLAALAGKSVFLAHDEVEKILNGRISQ